MHDDIRLRVMRPDDGPAIADLHQHTPDTGLISFASDFHVDPYATFAAMDAHRVGVVAEQRGRAGIVGMGMVTFGQCQYEGDLRPYAYLNTLSVHPAYRRRGIAAALADWRFEKAQAELGPEAVVYASIQTGNVGSLKTAARWATQTLEGCTRIGVVRVRRKPPASLPGIDVRPARSEEFEAIATRQNRFYVDHTFYEPQTAQSIAAWRARTLADQPLGDYYVAADATGSILAGMGVVWYGTFISNRIVHMPPAVRVANLLLKAVPSDDVMRRLQVQQFWFAPGQVAAGRSLWESVRWLCREQGTTLVAFYDPRGPIAKAVVLPRFSPTTSGSLLVRAPVPASAGRPVYWGG